LIQGTSECYTQAISWGMLRHHIVKEIYFTWSGPLSHSFTWFTQISFGVSKSQFLRTMKYITNMTCLPPAWFVCY